MMKVALITGGGSGIGRALAMHLASLGLEVYIVGRRADKLQETATSHPTRIYPIVADVSTEQGRTTVAAAIPAGTKLNYLIHNAAIADPLAVFEKITLADWRKIQAVNVEAPLFLSQLLLPKLIKGARILHISSGLAHRPLLGSVAYCASKAAMHMIYQGLQEELKPHGVLVGSVIPGIVDTEMQAHIRSKDARDYPLVDNFKNFVKDGQLQPAGKVAAGIAKLLLQTSDSQYPSKDWDVVEFI
jgi:NAD(P)-dependent dehydrogenase (short-subunit alcohol dehydrogenase family)